MRLNEPTNQEKIPFKAINWNNIEDMVDKLTFEKLTSQFWLDSRMIPSNDIQDWSKLSEKEQTPPQTGWCPSGFKKWLSP